MVHLVEVLLGVRRPIISNVRQLAALASSIAKGVGGGGGVPLIARASKSR